MKLKNLLLATAAAVTASGAMAQITDVRTNTVGTVVINPGFGSGVFVDDPIARVYRSDTTGHGAGFAAFTAVNSEFIYFENGAMSARSRNSAKAVTSVEIDFKNNTAVPQLDKMISTLFQSSFGFNVAEFDSSTGCDGSTLPDCTPVTTGVGFNGFGQAAGSPRAGLAGVGFSFEVLYDDVSVRKIGGTITMLRDSNGTISFLEDFGTGQDNLFTALNGFTLEANSNYAYIYHWDTTPFIADFTTTPGLLLPGEMAKITYRITTESWSQAINLFDRTSDNMIIGFSCVRDPVGRGDEVDSFSSAFRSFAVALDSTGEGTCSDDLPDFESNVLLLPKVVDGSLVFVSPDVVPEPATWAMMIAGFGLVGAAARRRKPATV